MTHTALARKYRPTRFSDLAAQEHVAAGLGGAVAKNRVAHAYLLTGPRGVGKTSAARILAMALNCADRADGEPCGTCDSCRRIWSGAANLDVVEIDAASNRGVDDARDLRERAMYAASGVDGYKVYIIDEAHMLTREAWNALLKILEEPPPRVVFVFATTEPQKIANTAAPVLSRVQRFDFRRIGPQVIADRLRHVAKAEQVEVEDDALVLIARVAAGGMRDGLSLLDQALAFGEGAVTAARVREALGLIPDELYGELLAIVAERRSEEVFPFVARVVEAGADLAEFVNGMGELLRALMVRLLGGEPEGLTDALRQVIARDADRFTAGDVLRMLRLLQETEQAVRRSPNARLHVETLLVQWALLDRTVELEEVLEALGGGKAVGRYGGKGEAERSRSKSGRGTAAGAADAPDAAEQNVPPYRPTAVPPSRPTAVPPDRPTALPPDGPLTLEAIREAWPAVVSAVSGRRRILREPLSHATPVALRDGTVVVGVPADQDLHLEGLSRGTPHVEEAIREVTGHRAQVAVEVEAAPPESPPAEGAKRLDPTSDRAERLRTYRQKDQALDAAAEALDLELLE